MFGEDDFRRTMKLNAEPQAAIAEDIDSKRRKEKRFYEFKKRKKMGFTHLCRRASIGFIAMKEVTVASWILVATEFRILPSNLNRISTTLIMEIKVVLRF
ncbi:hypothetical protein LOK49_LG04G01079 [Camellia lanceoleosa]|uniref:Uncharacterized protein n=1 Tax=Camellia lanceoleosa TaxID=1840588 RepID=A0ACC0HT64_9ERIC|nr:hypothetical protein LOK49_LG04G01079 [Camellia lanceoleosa]